MNKKVASLLISLMFSVSSAHVLAQDAYGGGPSLLSTQAVVTNLQTTRKESYATTNPPFIYLKRYSAGGENTQMTRLYLDGNDVSQFAVFGEESASYSPPVPLSLGKHEVVLRDISPAGTPISQGMTFSVEAGAPGAVVSGNVSTIATSSSYQSQSTYSGAPMSQTSQTQSYQGSSSTPMVQRNILLSRLETIRIMDNLSHPVHHDQDVAVILLGMPGGKANFDLLPQNSPGVAPYESGIRMKEIAPGMYAKIYRVHDADAFNSAMLVGHLSLTSGEIINGSTATINDMNFYPAYVGSPQYATVWVPDISAIAR